MASHGACKFSRKPTGDILAIGRIKKIHERIPNTHLVMYSASACHSSGWISAANTAEG